MGRASATSGCSARRNGASSRVAGFDSSTSTSRSSSVERRFTNVVLALRSVPGSSSSARPRATFSSPIARNAVLVLPTSASSSALRSAIADTVVAPSRRKRSSTAWSRASSLVRAVVLERNGAKYLMLSPASSPLPSYCVPEPRMKFRRPSRVSVSSALKTASMSTGAFVLSAPISPPSSISFASLGPGDRET